VRRSHGLRSPQLVGPGRGLDKWFFYPGFEPGTGGLIREPGLMDERRRFDGRAWLQARGIDVQPGERAVSLFCYASAPVGALLRALAPAPTLLLVTPGPATQALQAALAHQPAPATLRCITLPWLTQPDYDRLLWACDLNFVRGEDSFVRAIWSGNPFVWQIYPQHDGAHAPKLQALLGRMPPLAGLAPLWRAWNGLLADWPGLPEPGAWRQACESLRASLAGQTDLTTALQRFVCGKSRTVC